MTPHFSIPLRCPVNPIIFMGKEEKVRTDTQNTDRPGSWAFISSLLLVSFSSQCGEPTLGCLWWPPCRAGRAAVNMLQSSLCPQIAHIPKAHLAENISAFIPRALHGLSQCALFLANLIEKSQKQSRRLFLHLLLFAFSGPCINLDTGFSW